MEFFNREEDYERLSPCIPRREGQRIRMKRVEYALSIFSLALFVGCASAPVSRQNNYQARQPVTSTQNTAPSRVPATTASATPRGLPLDTALFEGAEYLASRIAARSKIAVVYIQAPTPNLSNYVTDSLSMYLVNKNSFVVIERTELAQIQREQRYQLSGEVSDETAVSLGRQLGAQFIITGSILPLGDRYSFRIKIITVETAQITGAQIFQVNNDRTMMALLAPPPAAVAPTRQTSAVRDERPQTVIQGDVNITNNNTTTINGDVYVNTPRGFGR